MFNKIHLSTFVLFFLSETSYAIDRLKFTNITILSFEDTLNEKLDTVHIFAEYHKS